VAAGLQDGDGAGEREECYLREKLLRPSGEVVFAVLIRHLKELRGASQNGDVVDRYFEVDAVTEFCGFLED